MIAFGRQSLSQSTRRDRVYRDGSVWKKSEWMLSEKDEDLSPTVFLIEQPANRALPAHFHHNNQFQIFIEGEGKIGARTAQPVTVHYADAYTAYGPITAGDDGIKYFTLRSRYEEGGVYVSNAEGKWPAGPRRHATSKPVAMREIGELRCLETVERSVLVPRSDEGLLVESLSLPPAVPLPTVEMGSAVGQFHFVLRGALRAGDILLAENESMFVSADESRPAMKAGPDGLQLLILAMPPRNPNFPPPPSTPL